MKNKYGLTLAFIGGIVGSLIVQFATAKKPAPVAAKKAKFTTELVINKPDSTEPAAPLAVQEVQPSTAVPFIEAVPLPLTPKVDRVINLDGKGRESSPALDKAAQHTAEWMVAEFKGAEKLAHTSFPDWFVKKHGVTRENVAWGGPGYDWEAIYPVWHGSAMHQINWQNGGHYMGHGKATAKNGVSYFVVIYSEKP